MQKFFLAIFIFSFGFTSVFSQNKSIVGTVRDTFNVKPVVFASVSLIRKADSILVNHTRSNQQGKFQLQVKEAGKYILLIAHGSFADYVDDIEVKNEDTEKELGVHSVYFNEVKC
jgi:hypothetical protein